MIDLFSCQNRPLRFSFDVWLVSETSVSSITSILEDDIPADTGQQFSRAPSHRCGVLVTFQRINRQAPRVSPAISDRISRERPPLHLLEIVNGALISREGSIYIRSRRLSPDIVSFLFHSYPVPMAWACIRSGISRSKSRLQRYEDASRPLSGIEIRFASKPSYREFFFTTAWTANYLQQFRFLLFVKKEKRKDAIWIFGEDRWFLWEENAEWRISRTIFSISYSPSKLESDLESFIVFVKLVSINRLVENARAIFQLRRPRD